MESDIIIFLKNFPRNELLKSVCTQLNLADDFHALDTCDNLLICISGTSSTKYGNNVLWSDCAFFKNKFLKDYFLNHDFNFFFLLKPVFMNWFNQTCENDVQFSNMFWNNLLSIYSRKCFLKCSLATKWFKGTLMQIWESPYMFVFI